jgi:hypothetical protein
MLLYVVNWQDTQRSHPDVPANYLNLLIHKIKKIKKIYGQETQRNHPRVTV